MEQWGCPGPQGFPKFITQVYFDPWERPVMRAMVGTWGHEHIMLVNTGASVIILAEKWVLEGALSKAPSTTITLRGYTVDSKEPEVVTSCPVQVGVLKTQTDFCIQDSEEDGILVSPFLRGNFLVIDLATAFFVAN